MNAPDPRLIWDDTDTPAVMARRLWSQVLLAAIEDALHPATAMRPSQGQSIAWFRSRDFAEVCSLAGLDAQAVLDRLRPHLIKAEKETSK
ncbi:hypothetical protein H0I76_09920 [Limibaculum sp. M0105]|uniref:Uncharacterized protein n=1 Tax=Thermohalobaculum xanthum TaxID=2753746 RepID=A0A8J7SDY0_9RHOB|nr:hypothetical protein [Thermohalobaculum xanthum]MBK0399508.1 hypothetical protein [Thermohalobaculum xanthum]